MRYIIYLYPSGRLRPTQSALRQSSAGLVKNRQTVFNETPSRREKGFYICMFESPSSARGGRRRREEEEGEKRSLNLVL